MQDAGCSIDAQLVEHPIMGIAAAVCALPMVSRLFRRFDDIARREPPDLLVLVDYPGFNFRLARRAKKLGIQVAYYVPPQIWAWASWRVRRMRNTIDHLLCSLPFEEAWYRSKGIHSARYIGHPFFDDLAGNPPDPAYVENLRRAGSAPNVVLLPGSRRWEVERNGRLLIEAACKLRASVPHVQCHVAAYDNDIADTMRRFAAQCKLTVSVHVQKTRELLSVADAAIAASGSVSLELLHFGVPTVIVYRIPWHWNFVLRPLLLNAPHVALVNLIAGRRLYPEFVGSSDMSDRVAQEAARFLEDDAHARRIRAALAALKRTYAVPGASNSAADYLLDNVLNQSLRSRRAA